MLRYSNALSLPPVQPVQGWAGNILDKSAVSLLTAGGLGATVSDIFISYSRDNSQFVEALIMALINYGWSVWSDKIAMSEGRPYDEQTEHAIGEATVTLVIWSQSSVKSRWVRAEAAYALQRDKLIPVIAEDVDPPLQFLHIQAVNLVGWDKTNDDLHFKKLAAALSGRLDRVGRIAQAEDEPKPPVKPDTPQPKGISAFQRKFFPAANPGFDEYFANRTFYIVQFVCGLVVAVVTFFGLIDLLSHASASHTVFRLLVEAPAFLILLALSFTPVAKRNSQKFAFAIGIVALLVVFISAQRMENTFPVTTGAATTIFLMILTVFAVLPLKTPNAAILGLLTFALHYGYIAGTHTPMNPGLQAGYSITVLSAMLALVAATYFRERGMRSSFLENERATAKIAELRERLMTLAVQQKQAKSRPPTKAIRDKSMLGPSK
jgi:TIR domain-containing protein